MFQNITQPNKQCSPQNDEVTTPPLHETFSFTIERKQTKINKAVVDNNNCE
eukprot:m.75598 g.75598  ORF g.75598 m.75598 type:complete len:51 (-) comp11849_c0_seq1:71-223(-)